MNSNKNNNFRIYIGFQMETFYIFSFRRNLSSQFLSLFFASFLRHNGNKSEK